MGELSQYELKSFFKYDKGHLFWMIKPANSVHVGDVAGYLHPDGYWRTKVKSVSYLNHRLIYCWHHGYFPENSVDHIDRNPINNRIENLREVSNVCNSRNTKLSTNNTSGINGVCWNNEHKHWRAQITDKKRICVCRTKDFVEAVAARLAAEQCLDWGDYHNSTSAAKYINKYLAGEL